MLWTKDLHDCYEDNYYTSVAVLRENLNEDISLNPDWGNYGFLKSSVTKLFLDLVKSQEKFSLVAFA